MTTMKKFIAAGIAVAALFGFAGCGNSNSGSGSGSTDVKLTVWAPQEDQVDADSWLPQMEVAFAKAHPEYNITWENKVVPEGDAGATVKQDASSAADVYLFANDQLGTLVDAGAIGQLSDDGVTQVNSQNSTVLINSVTGSDGELYGIPFTGNTWYMYYDTSVFTEDDVKSLDTMLEKGKVSFPLNNSWYLPAFYTGAGMTLFGSSGSEASAGIQLGDNAAAVTDYLVDLVANPNFVLDTGGASLAGLADGSVNVLFSGSWDAENVKEALGDNFGVAQPPTYNLNGQTVQMTAFAGSKAVAYNPNAEHYELAAMFAAFLGSTDAQLSHYKLRSIIPSDSSLSSNAEVSNDPVALAQIATIDNASIFQPTISAMADFWTPCENFGNALYNGEVTHDNAAEKTAAWAASY